MPDPSLLLLGRMGKQPLVDVICPLIYVDSFPVTSTLSAFIYSVCLCDRASLWLTYSIFTLLSFLLVESRYHCRQPNKQRNKNKKKGRERNYKPLFSHSSCCYGRQSVIILFSEKYKEKSDGISGKVLLSWCRYCLVFLLALSFSFLEVTHDDWNWSSHLASLKGHDYYWDFSYDVLQLPNWYQYFPSPGLLITWEKFPILCVSHCYLDFLLHQLTQFPN